MNDLLDIAQNQLGREGVARIGQRLGTSEEATGQAITAALPVLLGAQARNAQDPRGAESLAGALERDHDGSVLGQINDLIGDPARGNGSGILGHVLGAKRPRVEQYVAKTSGLDAGSAGPLLEMLAPVVMGALGQQKKRQDLDASGLAGMLGGLLQGGAIGAQAPGARPGQGNQLLNALLDQDGDGDITDDLLGMGGKMLGGLFGRKR